MERETKDKLLVIALDILELAEEAATADNPWLYVEHAEHLCEVVEVPITVALGTGLWPLHRAAMKVVNGAIDKLLQEGNE